MAIPSDVIARIPLAPVLIGQAIAVRRRALKLPEPDGARSGVKGKGALIRLLIVGDSSAAGVGAPMQEAALSGQIASHLSHEFTVHWQLEARTGDSTGDALKHLENLPAAKFDVAVTALGVNDVTQMIPLRRWIGQQKDLNDLLVDRFGVTRVFVSGIPPMGRFPLLPQPLRWVLGRQAERFDTNLKELLKGCPGAHHVQVDFPNDPKYVADDGYHPSPAAYAEWGGLLARRILGQ